MATATQEQARLRAIIRSEDMALERALSTATRRTLSAVSKLVRSQQRSGPQLTSAWRRPPPAHFQRQFLARKGHALRGSGGSGTRSTSTSTKRTAAPQRQAINATSSENPPASRASATSPRKRASAPGYGKRSRTAVHNAREASPSGPTPIHACAQRSSPSSRNGATKAGYRPGSLRAQCGCGPSTGRRRDCGSGPTTTRITNGSPHDSAAGRRRTRRNPRSTTTMPARARQSTSTRSPGSRHCPVSKRRRNTADQARPSVRRTRGHCASKRAASVSSRGDAASLPHVARPSSAASS